MVGSLGWSLAVVAGAGVAGIGRVAQIQTGSGGQPGQYTRSLRADLERGQLSGAGEPAPRRSGEPDDLIVGDYLNVSVDASCVVIVSALSAIV